MRSLREQLADRRYRRAMANIRRWCAIPDTVTDEEVLAAVRAMGQHAARVGVSAHVAAAGLRQAEQTMRHASLRLRETSGDSRGIASEEGA